MTCGSACAASSAASAAACVTAFGKLLGLEVTVVPNAGHMLPKEYVGDVLDKWLL